MLRLCLVCFFIFFSFSTNTLQAAFTHDPALSWTTMHTPHFQIHYHDGELELAQELAKIAEKTHSQLSQYFNWIPNSPTQVILTDRMDFSNGWATPIPRNTMTIIVSPPDEINSLEDYNNWLALVFIHEYTHVLHLDEVFGAPGVMRKIFGRYDLFFPNAFQPAWILEGIATYIETDDVNHVGRGQNTSYKTLMRVDVEHGIKPIYQVNQPMVSWPAGTTRYLYGVYFMNFIRDRYGDEQLRNWLYQYGNNFFWFINTNARNTLGENFKQLWKDFELYLNEQFRPTIDSIKAAGVTEGTNLSNAGYFTGYPRALPNGDLYYVSNDFASHPKLMVLKQGASKPKKVIDVEGERFDIHPSAGILMAKIDLVKSVNYFSDLYHIDFDGDETRLTKGKRYTYATWSPDGEQIVAVQNSTGNKALHLLSSKGEFIETLWQGADKTVISQPDWSPDGKTIIAAVWRPDTQWNLEAFSLQTKTWHKLTQTPFIEGQPQYTSDGSAVLFVADYNGVFNVMRLDLKSGNIDSLTNLLGGAFSVTPTADGKGIFYMGINADGHDVYQLAQAQTRPIEIKQTVEPSKAESKNPLKDIQPDDSFTVDSAKTTNYNGLTKLAPTVWLPTFNINDSNDVAELGITTYGNDPLYRHYYSLYFAYDFNKEIASGQFDYLYDRWNPSLKLSAQRNPQRYYQGENLRRIRMEETLTAELIYPFLKRDRQWALHLGLVNDTESDKWIDKNIAPLDTFTDELAGIATSYNSAKYYPKAISFSDGQRFRLVAEDSDLFDSDYTGQVYTLDWRGFLSVGHRHVLGGRLVGGWGTDAPQPFRLGGVDEGFVLGSPGNSIGMPTTQIFNKRDYALRGYKEGISQLIGRRMSLAELEWRFPIAMIERGFMSPPVGIHNIHGKVFYNVGDAWQDEFASSDLLQGAGVEFNTEIVIGYMLLLDLRVGYAHGFDETLGVDQVYVSVGGTF
jgi:Tol biopolymer transport system component